MACDLREVRIYTAAKDASGGRQSLYQRDPSEEATCLVLITITCTDIFFHLKRKYNFQRYPSSCFRAEFLVVFFSF